MRISDWSSDVCSSDLFAGEVPGLLRPRQWLRVDLVPLAVGGAIILRDISAAMDDLGAGDARRALADAIEAHGAIGRAVLSVREAIEDANEALTAMVGVDRSEEHTSQLQSLMRISYAVFCLKTQKQHKSNGDRETV